MYDEFEENIKLIDKFVHLENINDFLNKTFNINEPYILDLCKADDLDDILHMMII